MSPGHLDMPLPSKLILRKGSDIALRENKYFSSEYTAQKNFDEQDFR